MIQINTGEAKEPYGGKKEACARPEIQPTPESRPIPEEKDRGSLMTVTEMGRILGLKKTDRYWLIHKGLFETRIFLGKTWVVRDSFEKWYANQTHYHKVNGEDPGRELLERSYGAQDIAGMLGLSESTVYEIIKRENLNTVVIDHKIRIPKEDFEKWYACQEHYRTEEDRSRDAEAERNSITMPEMARLLGLERSQVYMILKAKRYKDIFEILVIAGKKRITRESFERFLEVQDRYRLFEKPSEKEAMEEPEGEHVERTDAGRGISPDMDMEKGNNSGRDLPPGRDQSNHSGQYLGISEAAEMIHVPEKLLYRWIWEGTIPSRKVGRKVFLEREVLEDWLEKKDGTDPVREDPARTGSYRAGVIGTGNAGKENRGITENSIKEGTQEWRR